MFGFFFIVPGLEFLIQYFVTAAEATCTWHLGRGSLRQPHLALPQHGGGKAARGKAARGKLGRTPQCTCCSILSAKRYQAMIIFHEDVNR